VAPTIKPREALGDFEEAIRIAREIGIPANEAWILWSLGLLYIVQGNLGRALEVTQNGLRIASEIEHREYIVGTLSILGGVHIELYAPEEARRQLEEALVLAKELRSQHWIHQVTGSLAAAHHMLGDLAQAQTYLETVISPQAPMDTINKRYCWARRAELALFQGNPTLALEITDRLIASVPGMSSDGVVTFLWKLKGEALAAIGRTDEAISLLRAAIENARATGERFLLWRVHASLGCLYQTLNHQTAAQQEFSAARELIEELAATIPDGALKDNFLRGAYRAITNPP
jgi:tetratricopeptide (TPR) repeat protein